jgi:hypothetical protein
MKKTYLDVVVVVVVVVVNLFSRFLSSPGPSPLEPMMHSNTQASSFIL